MKIGTDKPQKWDLISSVLESMTGFDDESFDFSEHLFIIKKLGKVLLFQENYGLKYIMCLNCLKLPHLRSQKRSKKKQNQEDKLRKQLLISLHL